MLASRLLVFALVVAPPLVAGEVYVPFLAADQPTTESGRSTVPQVDLVNLGAVTRRYSVHLIPAGEDGTRVRQLVGSRSLAPGEGAQESCCNRASGLLVVGGAPQIAVGAELALAFDQPPPNGLVTRLPALTAADALPASSSAVLQGLAGGNSDVRRSSFGILNFGLVRARCRVDIGFLDHRLPELREVDVPPLSVAAFPDVFLPLRGPSGPAPFLARPRVSCDQPFYPFGVNFVGDPGGPFPGPLPWVEQVPPSVRLGAAPR